MEVNTFTCYLESVIHHMPHCLSSCRTDTLLCGKYLKFQFLIKLNSFIHSLKEEHSCIKIVSYHHLYVHWYTSMPGVWDETIFVLGRITWMDSKLYRCKINRNLVSPGMGLNDAFHSFLMWWDTSFLLCRQQKFCFACFLHNYWYSEMNIGQ